MSVRGFFNMKTIYHVIPDNHFWAVKVEHGRMLKRFKKQQFAIQYAKKIAKKRKPSQIVIHRQDGTVREERSYDSKK